MTAALIALRAQSEAVYAEWLKTGSDKAITLYMEINKKIMALVRQQLGGE